MTRDTLPVYILDTCQGVKQPYFLHPNRPYTGRVTAGTPGRVPNHAARFFVRPAPTAKPKEYNDGSETKKSIQKDTL